MERLSRGFGIQTVLSVIEWINLFTDALFPKLLLDVLQLSKIWQVWKRSILNCLGKGGEQEEIWKVGGVVGKSVDLAQVYPNKYALYGFLDF